jgi:hypothetical protein
LSGKAGQRPHITLGFEHQALLVAKPLLIIADDVEIAPGAQFRGEVAGAGHVVQRTHRLALGHGSSYFGSISASGDTDPRQTRKRAPAHPATCHHIDDTLALTAAQDRTPTPQNHWRGRLLAKGASAS